MKETQDLRGKALKLAGMVEYSNGSVVSKTLMDKKSGTLTVFSWAFATTRSRTPS